ncbi:F-box/LRR-repeat protein 7, partial [Austrofundulus limnaeus]
MGANNGKQYGSEGKGSSSISSDISSSTDHTPTKALKNEATTEGLETSTRTLSTPSPGLILPSKSSSLSSPALSSNGHETNSSSSSSAHTETVAVIHPQ